MVPLLKLRLTGAVGGGVGVRGTEGQNGDTGMGVAPWWRLGIVPHYPHHTAAPHPPGPSRPGVPAVALTFGDAMLCRQQALLDETLQH